MSHRLFLKKVISVVFIVLISLIVIDAGGVSAQGGDKGNSVGSLLEEAGKAAKYNVTDVKEGKITTASIAGGIIKIFLSFLGIIFTVLMIYGGYLWMMARGNQEQVTKAKELIINAVIGLVIVVAAYAITYFALYMLAREYVQESGFN
ncbi:MAG: hypothetical protein PHQ42_00940 [Patescibacteria group bacterium]|nr:hypothetical protein [Patescibacteria group bacterium]